MKKLVLLAFVLVLFFSFSLSTSLVTYAEEATEATENSWASKTPMHQARGGLGVAAMNGKIYAIGGSTQSGFSPSTGGPAVFREFVGTNEEYDPATDTWTFKKPMPTPRYTFATAVYQNKIYCIGGKTSSGYTGVNEVYDPVTDTWETKASMPTARGWLTASVVNGKIYLIGGYPNWTLNEVYDPATNSWTTKASMPTLPTDGWVHVSTAFDSKVYVVSSRLHVYDPRTDEWSLGAPPPSGIMPGSVAVVTLGVLASERIYVVGAANYVYDPKNYSWTRGADVPTKRYNFGVAVVNDTLYAIGGHTYNYIPGDFAPTSVNDQYTPIGYGTIPPTVHVVSPENNRTYTETDVSLTFTKNKPVVWMGYSLDGQERVTIAGNTTLSGLSSGSHNITVYATDTFGNTGTSETIYFTIVQQSESFPIWIVAAIAIMAVGGAALLVYFRKIRKTTEKAEK